MKVKEIPISLFHSLRLMTLSKKRLTKNGRNSPLIVSLATIPSRLNIVHLTIRSILNQSILPEKIILWLHKDLKNSIPKKLSRLEGEFFEIRFSKLTSSHRKLVNTLKIYPNHIIITCDDDMIYRKNWLENIYNAHQKSPTSIIANQVRCISYYDNKVLAYTKWALINGACNNGKALLPIGACGTLYPPNSLFKDVINSELFLKLTPTTDDLWFKAMSLKQNTTSLLSEYLTKEPIPIWGSQGVSLKKGNIKEDKNRIQWRKVADYYSLHELVK
ncbi:zinc-binding alcohol dehydrogenase [Croceitalea rosinachiae]|uniref:Zinc-binding alcohol dehydrogenase n=1 Tax=Croceitalea rosinachiae TaxID=3075596 RepID=A0ABU3AFD8_9FLAO|nr:zinc-binding alcohol dehydrogenase [Croceitalea sp. F388]MDT0608267.1 zinc-binding alcohol dehydrogenase [Croceitalea sp. F388]